MPVINSLWDSWGELLVWNFHFEIALHELCQLYFSSSFWQPLHCLYTKQGLTSLNLQWLWLAIFSYWDVRRIGIKLPFIAEHYTFINELPTNEFIMSFIQSVNLRAHLLRHGVHFVGNNALIPLFSMHFLRDLYSIHYIFTFTARMILSIYIS